MGVYLIVLLTLLNTFDIMRERNNVIAIIKKM